MPKKGRFREAFPYEREEDFAHWAWMRRVVAPERSGEERLRELERLEADAKAGDDRAALAFVRHLLKNPDEPRRFARARHLLSSPIQKEMPEALHLAGLMALRGEGEPPDEEKALRLVERAAYLGRVEAMLDAARLYESVFPDEKKSLYWWRLAAAHGVVSAQRKTGEKLLAAARGEEELKVARDMLERAASDHDRDAAFLLFRLYARRGPLEDRDASLFWLKESALSGDTDAQYRLGILHWAGQRVPVNQREAVRWIARAAEGGHFGAMEMLANLFLSGSSVPVNRVYGCALLRTAKRLGDKNAGALLRTLTPLLKRRDFEEVRRLMREAPDAASLVEAILPRRSR